jgi:ataxia telangiectasia mutated family protein
LIILINRTASEVKVKRVQETLADTTVNLAPFGLGIGIDMSSGTAEEAADRALSSVARKLDRALSVEYTVNELVAEATDPVNLATIFSGMWFLYIFLLSKLTAFRMES